MKRPPRVIYKGEPKPNSWCRWAVYRVKRRNNSTNVRMVGDTGTGKSWSGLSFAEICARLLGYKFSPERIYFSIKDVIDEVAENEPKPGTVFFIDEQQIGAYSGDHQKKRARAYAFFFSTVRSNRYIIITTMPFSDMELKNVRRFTQVEIETHGANLTTNTVRSTPRFIENSRIKKDKVYRKRLIVVFKDPKTGMNKIRKLSYWDIPAPSKELREIYEIRKAEFKRKLYKKLSKELAEEEVDTTHTSAAQANQDVLQTLTPYQKAIYELMSQGHKVQKEVNEKLIEQGFNSSKEKVSMNLKWMRKKGVVIIK